MQHQSERNLAGAASGHSKYWFDGLMEARELSWDSDWVQTLFPQKQFSLTLFSQIG